MNSERAIDDVSSDNLRSLMVKELVLNPELCEWSHAWVSDTLEKPVDEYWIESGRLLDERVRDDEIIVESINFARVLDLANQYWERDRHRATATFYWALFKHIE